MALVNRELVLPAQQLEGASSLVAKAVLSVVNGHAAVILFFVLSGFVLGQSLDRLKGSALRICLSFAVRRLFRIYPAVFAAIALFAAVAAAFGPLRGLPALELTAPLQNALLTKITWHGATWTLQAEVLAVPFLLIFHFAKRCLGTAGLLLCLGYCLAARETPALTFGLPNMAVVLAPMCAGMLMASEAAEAMLARAARATPWIATAGLFGLIAFLPIGAATAELALVLLCAVLIGYCYWNGAGAFVRLIGSPVPAYLGGISYGLYLVNVPILIVLSSLFPLDSLGPGLLVGLLTTIASVPAAHVFRRCVEQPGIKLGEVLLAAGRAGEESEKKFRTEPAGILTSPRSRGEVGAKRRVRAREPALLDHLAGRSANLTFSVIVRLDVRTGRSSTPPRCKTKLIQST